MSAPITAVSPTFLVARVRGHLVARISGPPAPENVAVLRELVRREFGAGAARFGYYLFLSEGVAPPEEATRAALRQFAGELGTRLYSIVVVLETPGFLGAALRGVVTGIALALRNSFRVSVHATIDEAVRWTTDELRKQPAYAPLTADELRAARKQFDAHDAR